MWPFSPQFGCVMATDFCDMKDFFLLWWITLSSFVGMRLCVTAVARFFRGALATIELVLFVILIYCQGSLRFRLPLQVKRFIEGR